jgi:hypothetical protein
MLVSCSTDAVSCSTDAESTILYKRSVEMEQEDAEPSRVFAFSRRTTDDDNQSRTSKFSQASSFGKKKKGSPEAKQDYAIQSKSSNLSRTSTLKRQDDDIDIQSKASTSSRTSFRFGRQNIFHPETRQDDGIQSKATNSIWKRRDSQVDKESSRDNKKKGSENVTLEMNHGSSKIKKENERQGSPRRERRDSQREKSHESPKTKQQRPQGSPLMKERKSTIAATSLMHPPSSSRTKQGSAHRAQRSPHTEMQRSLNKKGEKDAPTIEYQEDDRKWVIANHQSQCPKNKCVVLTIHAFDPQQQVFIYNCHNVSIQIIGERINALRLKNCSQVSVVFETIIFKCAIASCSQLSLQTTGICPTFDIDKTDGAMVWLSKESTPISTFVTSKSTDINVSVPQGASDDDNERKVVTIPQQFVHRLHGGEVASAITTAVSDLY